MVFLWLIFPCNKQGSPEAPSMISCVMIDIDSKFDYPTQLLKDGTSKLPFAKCLHKHSVLRCTLNTSNTTH